MACISGVLFIVDSKVNAPVSYFVLRRGNGANHDEQPTQRRAPCENLGSQHFNIRDYTGNKKPASAFAKNGLLAVRF